MRTGKIVLLWAVLAGVAGCNCDLVVNFGDAGAGGGSGGGGVGGAGGGAVDAGCVDGDGDGFGVGRCLGLDCDDGNPAITLKLTTPCTVSDAGKLVVGSGCKSVTCINGVFGACAPLNVEQCNGLDDDCDLVVDNDIPKMPCYSGSPQSLQAGANAICRSGLRGCTDGGFGTCEGEVTPRLELCMNMKDDNCNGITDEPLCVAGTYVCGSCLGALDTNSGAANFPVKTIGQGILHAVALKQQIVFVAGLVGSTPVQYREDVLIPNGVVVQGKWAVNGTAANRVWTQAANAPRTRLVNSNPGGLEFVAGAGRSSGIEGMSIQAETTMAQPRSIGISIFNASPLLKDFEVIPAGAGSPIPLESIGVLISGTAPGALAPRLEGTPTVTSSVISGGGADGGASIGIRVAGARVDLQYLEVNGGDVPSGLSVAVHLVGAQPSLVKDCGLFGGKAKVCLGLYSQFGADGVQLDNVTAIGCPAEGGASVLTKSFAAGGIVFEACPAVSTPFGPPLVKNSNALGGSVHGTGSLAVGAAASDGCRVSFSNNTLTGGAGASNIPETQVGLVCSFKSMSDAQGADAPCRVVSNIISSGSAIAEKSMGLVCEGSCATKTASCMGSCVDVQENSVSARNGRLNIHLGIADSSPLVSRNKIGFDKLGPVDCFRGTIIGVELLGSGATLTNNIISGAPCQYAVGVDQVNSVRSDTSIASPVVHFNTVIPSGMGASPDGGVSFGIQLRSLEGVPDAGVFKGVWRNNIIAAGPIPGLQIPVREADHKSDPATFSNNLLVVNSITVPILYLDEGNTPLTTLTSVDAQTNGANQTDTTGGFVSAADFHITSSSRAVGNGGLFSVPPIDYDGEPRPRPDGGKPDIGADEIL